MRRGSPRFAGIFGLALCLMLTLGGCHAPFSLPRATEPRSIAIAGVLGVDRNGETVTAFAATQQRGDDPPLSFQGEGNSLAAARLATRDQKTRTVSYAHVEHLVISPAVAADYLDELLSYSFQNGEQSMESKLWVLTEGSLEDLFAGEVDVAGRLSALQIGAKAGTTLPGRSLRQIATRLLDGGDLLLPALKLEGDVLEFDGYVLVHEGVPVAQVRESVARSVAVLSGEEVYWTQTVTSKSGGTGVVQLHSHGVRVKPQFSGESLTGLTVTCELDGQLMELWSADEVEKLREQVTQGAQRELLVAVKILQLNETDGAQFRRRAGLANPWRWDDLNEEWGTLFPTLPVEVKVEAALNT